MTLTNFFKHVKPSSQSSCLIFTGRVNRRGYGRVGHTNAHRWVMQQFHGELPTTTYVCHRCKNKNCVNPAHLYLGNAQTNIRDAVQAGNFALGPGENHWNSKLTREDVLYIKAHPDVKSKELAQQFGVKYRTINYIRSGRRWAHVG